MSRLFVITTVVALGACEPRYAPGEEPALDVSVDERIVEAGGALPIELEVRNFDLDDDATAFVAGQGHLHIFLDHRTDGGDLKLLTTAGQSVRVPLEQPAGAHKLVFQLHYADHSPVETAPDRTFDVTVVDPPLDFVVQRVTGAPYRPAGDVTAEITVAGFVLDADGYEDADVLRHGHYHVHVEQGGDAVDLGPFFDGKARFALPSTLAAGAATLRFELHGNTHVALDPPVVVEQAIDVEE